MYLGYYYTGWLKKMNTYNIIYGIITVILTTITILCIYVDYIHGRLINKTLIILCILNIIMIISAVFLFVDYTTIKSLVEIKKLAKRKWYQIDFEIRTWIQIIVYIAVVICIGLLIQSIYVRS